MRSRGFVLSILVSALLLVGVTPAGAGPAQITGNHFGRTFVSNSGPFPFVSSSVDLDSQGNVYVLGKVQEEFELQGRVRKYSPAGVLLLTVHMGDDGGPWYADDIAVDSVGNIILLDKKNSRVIKYNAAGAFVNQWNPSAGMNPAQTSPRGLAVDSAGYVYVGDQYRSTGYIRKFNQQGTLVASFGTRGRAPGQLDGLTAIAIAPTGHIYTAESEVSRVQKFYPGGNFAASWYVPCEGSGNYPGTGPQNVEVAPNGSVYVWQAVQFHSLFVYSAAGTPLATHDQLEHAFTSGGFDRNTAVHSDGTIYVADGVNTYSFSPIPDPPASEAPQRISGTTRYDTAVAISKASFPSADTVVIATGENFPDALSGSGLCGAYGAPLLLTKHDTLPASVLAEVSRLGATKAFIIGGADVVNDTVKAVLQDAGLAVTRLEGDSRYETSAVVAAEVAAKTGAGFGEIALVARGDSYPDALALAPFAYSQKAPILLVRRDGASSAAHDAIASLGVTSVLVAGGSDVVPDSVVAALGVPSSRASGATRYETSIAVADYGISHGWGSAGFVGIATGTNFPDALAGGPACGKNGGVILMTKASPLHDATATWLTSHKASITRAQVYGGADVVSAGVRVKIQEIMGW